MPSLTPRASNTLLMDRAADLVGALQQAGLRITPQRVAVCRALAGTKTHPTAQALFEQLRPAHPSLSRATVYNTLQTLVRVGAVHELGTAGDGTRHYDADVSPHANLICTRCHRVDDLPVARLDEVARQVERDSGYELRGARTVYYGLCPGCRRAARRPA